MLFMLLSHYILTPMEPAISSTSETCGTRNFVYVGNMYLIYEQTHIVLTLDCRPHVSP